MSDWIHHGAWRKSWACRSWGPYSSLVCSLASKVRTEHRTCNSSCCWDLGSQDQVVSCSGSWSWRVNPEVGWEFINQGLWWLLLSVNFFTGFSIRGLLLRVCQALCLAYALKRELFCWLAGSEGMWAFFGSSYILNFCWRVFELFHISVVYSATGFSRV